MDLKYCEVCGVLIAPKRGGGADRSEDYICERCFRSRKVLIPADDQADEGASIARDEQAGGAGGGEAASASGTRKVFKFPCCYCQSLLQIKAVRKRSKIRCPKCSEEFFLNPDGAVEALSDRGSPAGIEKGGSAAEGASSDTSSEDRTRPIEKKAKRQEEMLEDLKPKKFELFDDVPPAHPAPDRPTARVIEDSSAHLDVSPAKGAAVPPPAAPSAPAAAAAPLPAPEPKLDLLPVDQPVAARPHVPGRADAKRKTAERAAVVPPPKTPVAPRPRSARLEKRRTGERAAAGAADGGTDGSGPRLVLALLAAVLPLVAGVALALAAAQGFLPAGGGPSDKLVGIGERVRRGMREVDARTLRTGALGVAETGGPESTPPANDASAPPATGAP